MKKILVFGALSLFGLSDTGAIDGGTINSVASSQKQEVVTIEVKENENENESGGWKTVPLTEVKIYSIYGIELSGLKKEEAVMEALNMLLQYEEPVEAIDMPLQYEKPVLEKTVLKELGLGPEEEYLYNLLCVKFGDFEIRDCTINGEIFQSVIWVLEKYRSLRAISMDDIYREISPEKMLDLYRTAKDCPVLYSMAVGPCDKLDTVQETFADLALERFLMLYVLKRCIENKDKSLVEEYKSCKKEVRRLTSRLGGAIETARKELEQENEQRMLMLMQRPTISQDEMLKQLLINLKKNDALRVFKLSADGKIIVPNVAEVKEEREQSADEEIRSLNETEVEEKQEESADERVEDQGKADVKEEDEQLLPPPAKKAKS